MTVRSPDLLTALAFARAWRDAGHSLAEKEIVPPCDELGDTTYDVMLAVIFRDLVKLDTLTERIARISAAIEVDLPMIEFCRERKQADAADRIERMVDVLRKWSDELIAAPVSSEERAA